MLRKIFTLPLKILYSSFFALERFYEWILPLRYHRTFRSEIIGIIDSDSETVKHIASDNTEIIFKLHVPNSICSIRWRTFSSKEEDLLLWIDEFGGDGAFYDIGSNIGIYSLYYAMSKPGNVYSFEPSAPNTLQLMKNISTNSLHEKIQVFTNPLNNKSGVNNFSFNEEYGKANNQFSDVVRDNNVNTLILGFSLDDLMDFGFINEPPSLVKIDVDGIDHLILEGAKKILKLSSCKSVLVETITNKNYKNISAILEECGYYLSNPNSKDNVYNQIWFKKN